MQIKAITSKTGYINSSIITENYTPVIIISIGMDIYGYSTWAIMSDGKIYAFGYYALGVDTYEYPNMLEKSSPAGNIVWGTAYDCNGTLFIDEDGQLWWIGSTGYHSTLPEGSHSSEDITIGTTDHDFITQTYSSIPPMLSKVSTGEYVAAGIDEDGKLWIWGNDGSWGCLGQNYTTGGYAYTPIEIWTGSWRGETNTGWTDIFSGWGKVMGIKDGDVWFWGPNVSGSGGVGCNQYLTGYYGWKWTLSAGGVGNEYYLEKLAGGDPEIIEPTHYYQGWPYSSGFSGYLDKGTIGNLIIGEWNWGDNDGLGFDTIYVRLLNDVDPDTGSYYSAQPEYNAPVKVTDTGDYVKIMCQEYTTVALKSDGTLWGWGDNYLGSMGHDPATCVDYDFPKTPPITHCQHWTPKDITPPGKTIVDFSAGFYHIIALEADGTAWAVGYDDQEGCLGLGSYLDSVYTWTEIPGIKFRSVQCHYSSSMGIGMDGKIYVWGLQEGLSGNTPTFWDFGGYWS